MSIYLSEDTLKEAVERLGQSSAGSSLGDYLIFKRALVLHKDSSDNPITIDRVVTGTRSTAYVRAISEVTALDPDTTQPLDSNPYFVPFGAKRDSTHGYRTVKFPSNGSSDTVGRWQSRPNPPLSLVPGTSPKEYVFESRSESELREFFIKKNAQEHFSGNRPNLLDCAVWWLRAINLAERFGHEPGPDQIIASFTKDLALTQIELRAIFSDAAIDQNTDIDFSSQIARPSLYLPEASRPTGQIKMPSPSRPKDTSIQSRINDLTDYIKGTGFIFDPWQIAAYVTAVRTKPFVILAGISGTGKTKLPRLVAEATGSVCHIEPVRADWTDSSELLGYERLDGVFQPGSLLRFAESASLDPSKQYFYVLDEMNIARVEHYLAEVLSHIEERHKDTDGRWYSKPLRPNSGSARWDVVRIPENLCIVGSVNMDETTYGFSRKVLDRAFVIEFSKIDLSAIGQPDDLNLDILPWTADEWRPQSLTLATHPQRNEPEVAQIVETLMTVNSHLEQGQLQFGYRVRDEIAMFCLAAQQCAESFTTEVGGAFDPLDLAINMKVLPRLQGSGSTIKRVLEDLIGWAMPSRISSELPVKESVKSGFPISADRIELMTHRLGDSGYTSYWL